MRRLGITCALRLGRGGGGVLRLRRPVHRNRRHGPYISLRLRSLRPRPGRPRHGQRRLGALLRLQLRRQVDLRLLADPSQRHWLSRSRRREDPSLYGGVRSRVGGLRQGERAREARLLRRHAGRRRQGRGLRDRALRHLPHFLSEGREEPPSRRPALVHNEAQARFRLHPLRRRRAGRQDRRLGQGRRQQLGRAHLRLQDGVLPAVPVGEGSRLRLRRVVGRAARGEGRALRARRRFRRRAQPRRGDTRLGPRPRRSCRGREVVEDAFLRGGRGQRRPEAQLLHLPLPPLRPAEQYCRCRPQALLLHAFHLGHLPRGASALHDPRSREGGGIRRLDAGAGPSHGVSSDLDLVGSGQPVHDRHTFHSRHRRLVPEGKSCQSC